MQQETSAPEMVLYNETHGCVVDLVRDGQCVYAHVTPDELRKHYGDPLTLMSQEDAALRIEQHFSRSPREVDRERWESALDVLPPMNWVRGAQYESFYISEPITSTVHTVLVRIGERYFEFAQPRRTRHSQLVQMVQDVINAAAATQDADAASAAA